MTRRLGTTTLLATLAGALVTLVLLAGGTAPSAHGAEALLESLSVPGGGAPVQTTTQLRQGATYRLVVTGFVFFHYGLPTVPSARTEAHDALYCWSVTGYLYPGELCLEGGPTGPLPTSALQFGGASGPLRNLNALAGRTLPYVPNVQDPSHRYEVSFVAASSSALLIRPNTFTSATGASGQFTIQLFGEAAPAPPPVTPPAAPPTCTVDADPFTVGCQSAPVSCCTPSNDCTIGDDQILNSAKRRASQRVLCPEVSARPVRTATAGRDGTATAPAPTVGNPTAAASPPLGADQEEAIAVIVNKEDAQAVGFTLALTKGISKNEIQQYCLDRALALLLVQFDDLAFFGAAGLTISGFAYCMRSLDRALRATGQASQSLMAVEAASCRMTPRLVTIRRVARARLRVRNAKVRAVTGVRARATCTTRADGSVAIRVKSAAGTPLRRVVGPRLRIGFVQGRGAKAGPVEVRFR